MSVIMSASFFDGVLAFLVAFATALLLGKPMIYFLQRLKIGQMIQTFDGFLLGSLHKDKKDTPTMGGILIIVATAVSCCVFADLSCFEVRILMSTLLLFGALGACDDFGKMLSKSSKGLSSKIRLVAESGIAIAVIWSFSKEVSPREIFTPFNCKILVCSGLLLMFLQWFTIVGSANAVNLTDGLDGLATGLCSIASLPLIFFAIYSVNTPQIAICLSALCGASLGFLWFNTHPGSVFMGDTGSLALGGMLGVSAVLMGGEWLLALTGLVFVIETLSVIIQVISFKMTKKRLFRCTPLHHHFEYLGIPEERVVVRFWILGLILALLGICSFI